nr:MAG TPA: hypothetical protein [Caudoviricetes sp.]
MIYTCPKTFIYNDCKALNKKEDEIMHDIPYVMHHFTF